MRITSVLILSALSLLMIEAPAQTPQLVVSRPWIQAVPGSVSDTVAYMTLHNTGSTALSVVGASTLVADMVHPMITTKGKGDQGMMGMEDIARFEIPAGGTLVLAPGGNHLMIMGLKRALKEGETVPLTLKTQPGNRTIQVMATVAKQAPGGKGL
jgi:copper(I)-binding protein